MYVFILMFYTVDGRMQCIYVTKFMHCVHAPVAHLALDSYVYFCKCCTLFYVIRYSTHIIYV